MSKTVIPLNKSACYRCSYRGDDKGHRTIRCFYKSKKGVDLHVKAYITEGVLMLPEILLGSDKPIRCPLLNDDEKLNLKIQKLKDRIAKYNEVIYEKKLQIEKCKEELKELEAIDNNEHD